MGLGGRRQDGDIVMWPSVGYKIYLSTSYHPDVQSFATGGCFFSRIEYDMGDCDCYND